MEIFFNIDETEKGFLYEESMRMLRTNLQFSGGNLRVILFTSSIQDEGKSETSFQLAMSFAKLDKKVLYVDADMRKSVFTTRYQIKENVQGLSQYLSGQNTEDIVYKTNIKNMDVVFAGPYAPNPAELLYENKLDEFIKKQRLQYDYIIIDAPPLANIVDAAVIGRCVDGAVIVVKSATVSQRMVKRVKDQLEKVNCKIIGAVLNGVEMKKNSYHYKYYGDYYGNKK
nr:CpsD/CapB family tyrosine-protein kinase [uncultured Lachnoanaerobaculum sp.]